MQLSAHSPRKRQMYSRLHLINIHNRLNYSQRCPWCGRNEEKKRMFCRNVLRAAPQSTMSQQIQNVFDFVQASSREGSRESGPAEHHVDLFHRVNPVLMRDSTALARKSSPLYMNRLGPARSLLTSSLRRNSPGPGSPASSPPSVCILLSWEWKER